MTWNIKLTLNITKTPLTLHFVFSYSDSAKNKNPLTSRRFLRDWASSLWTCFLSCCFHTDRRWPRRHMTRAVGSGRSCPGSKRSRLWWRCSRDRPAWTRTASRCRYLWATTEEEQPRDRRETTTGRCTVASYYTGSNPTVFSTKNVAATYRAEVCTSMLLVWILRLP